MSWLLIGLGGAAGTLLRWGLSLLLADHTLESGWPLGTLVANALGSLLLGVVVQLAEGAELLGGDLRLVLGVGVMGGFTTYSSFNLETIRLAEQGHLGRAALYVSVTLVVCLVAGLGGLALARLAR